MAHRYRAWMEDKWPIHTWQMRVIYVAHMCNIYMAHMCDIYVADIYEPAWMECKWPIHMWQMRVIYMAHMCDIHIAHMCDIYVADIMWRIWHVSYISSLDGVHVFHLYVWDMCDICVAHMCDVYVAHMCNIYVICVTYMWLIPHGSYVSSCDSHEPQLWLIWTTAVAHMSHCCGSYVADIMRLIWHGSYVSRLDGVHVAHSYIWQIYGSYVWHICGWYHVAHMTWLIYIELGHSHDGKLRFLSTNSNRTEITIWICTTRHRGICVFSFSGYRGSIWRIFRGKCRKWAEFKVWQMS